MVAMGMTNDSMAWARPSHTVLITVGREKPAALQDIIGVQGGTSLATHQFGSCTLGTGVVQVWGCNTERGVAMGHLAFTWRECMG